MEKYNLSQLFKTAFGINSPIFITEPLSKQQNQSFDFKGIGIIEDYYTKDATSWMGTPIIGLLKFNGGFYNKYNQIGEIVPKQFPDFTLPPATLFSFRRSKNVIKTNILGGNGTIKEVFGFDDWIIDVKGLAVDTPNSSARKQIEELLNWEDLADQISISGDLFSKKDISAVVIEDFKQESIQGNPTVIPFSMTLISDQDIVLIL
jgi:hypothetical protein